MKKVLTPTLRNSLSGDAQNLVKRIQEYITQNLYTCTNKILRGLGKMYSGGGDFTTNIDAYGGRYCGLCSKSDRDLLRQCRVNCNCM